MIRTLLAGAALAALSAGTAAALPITYTLAGTGTLNVGGTFYDGAWEIVATGDTDAVSPAGGDFVFASNAVTATLSAGDGALFTEIVEPLWAAQGGSDVGFAADPDGLGVIETGIVARAAGGFAYDLASDFGPFTADYFGGPIGVDSLSTAAGIFDPSTADVAEATFTAVVDGAEVPLPAPAALLVAGLGALAAARRRRRAAA
jgi:hypothetical protein